MSNNDLCLVLVLIYSLCMCVNMCVYLRVVDAALRPTKFEQIELNRIKTVQ